MTTYEQDLTELGITSEQYDRIISVVYDKTAEEMVELAKIIKKNPDIMPTAKRAFERVLNMRVCERKEAYDVYYGHN